MVSPLRQIGRWGKRTYLEQRLNAAPPAQKKFWNERLNWREFWHGRTRLHSFPLHVQLGTNWTCNLHCFFCRREVEPYRQGFKDMPANELQISPTVYDAARLILPHALSFSLTPLGEPILYSKFNKFLEIHGELGSENLCFTTNGVLIDDRRAEAIVRSRVSTVYMSIDSSNPERYAELRVGATLDQFERGLNRLVEWKKKLDSDLPHIAFATTFMRRNIEDLPDLVRFASKGGADELVVQLMEPEAPELEPEMLWHHVPITAKMVGEAQRLGRELGLKINVGLAMKNLLSAAAAGGGDGAAEIEVAPEIDTRGQSLVEKCRYPWSSILIDTDGDVRPCCWAGSSHGNLNEKSFDEIWNGKAVQEMRRDFLADHVPEGCRKKHCRVDL
jgi:radical SAM protein with 4Fe4S-binding SPASM domain